MTSHHPTYRFDKSSFEKLDKFVERILKEGFEEFSDEFERIPNFLKLAASDPVDRDDHRMRMSTREKYLLEAISFGVYDRLNREAFNKTKETLIIMPDCLSLDNSECEKVETPIGKVCKSCDISCHAYEVVHLAQKYKCKVIFSKKKLSEQLEHFASKAENIGVIGVACIMMLAQGMRVAAELGIPARGLLLNCTGCDHWNDKPFGSDLEIERLENILREKHGTRD